jgi:hypothetical protein
MLVLVTCCKMTQPKPGKIQLTFSLLNITLMEHFWDIFLLDHNSQFAKLNS